MNIKKTIFACLLIAVLMASCDVVNQINQTAQLAKCKFNLAGLSNVTVSGISIESNMKVSNLNAVQALQITQAVARKSLPVTFNVGVKVDNPNSKTAGMNRMDYILMLDGKEMITGAFSEKISIPGGSTQTVAVPITVDLFKVFSNENSDAIVNIAMKLGGNKTNPSKLSMKLKPYVEVGGRSLSYPNYLDLSYTLN